MMVAPMLDAFLHGRQTELVVDIGASGCCVTPVVDGLLLKQAQRRNRRGGDWLGIALVFKQHPPEVDSSIEKPCKISSTIFERRNMSNYPGGATILLYHL
jgi:actin-related protein